jgi:VCBS repeat-containing protein
VSTPNGSGDLVIAGTYGTLTIHADGTYSYLATQGSIPPAGATETFTYLITDGDNDTDTATLTINVADHNLTPSGGTVNAFVDDEGLAGGILGGTGDIDANSGEAGSGTSSEAVWTGTLSGSGGDAPISFLFSASLNGTSVMVGTESATYSVSADGLTLTATGPRGVLFTVHIDNASTGAYTLTLSDNVLQTYGDNTEASATVDIPYTVKDVDGTTAPGTIHATFNDDSPTAVSAVPVTSGLDNGGGDSVTQSLDSLDNNVFNNFGADGGKVIFTQATITSLESQNLTHGTQPLSYVISADGQTLTGYVDNGNGTFGAGDTSVFTVQLQPGNSSNYTVTMLESLDSLTTIDFDDGTYAHTGGNTPWFGFFLAGDNDSSDLLITPVENGARSGTVNLNGNLFGVSQGNSVGSGEGVRIDFVTDLSGDAAGSGGYQTAANRDHSFDGHYTVNGATTSFGSTPGAVVKISAFDDPDGNNVVGDGNPDSVTGIAISYNGATSGLLTAADDDDHDGIVEASDSDGIVNVTVGGHAFTVVFNADGTVNVGGVTGNSNGTSTTDIAVFTADGYNALQFDYVSGTAFLIGNFGAAVPTTDPVDFTVPISVVDGDGDTVSSGNIAIEVSGSTGGAAILAVPNSAMSVNSASTMSSTLVSSNDNHLEQRGPATGGNVGLVGAIAAAGLAASHSVAAQGNVAHVEQSAQATGSVAVTAPPDSAAVSAAGDSVAHGGGLLAASVGEHAHQPATGLRAAIAELHGHVAASTRDAGHQAELHHGGAEASTHGSSAGASHVVAAAVVAMPSAEQLGALVAKAHGPDGSVAGANAQHNQVVGKVLADALHGGDGHGANIDALINGLPGHNGAAPDALQALASHGDAAVSFGHTGFGGAFGGGHAMLSMEMALHDAAPAHG